MSTILTVLAVVAAATPGLLVTPAELAAALENPAVVVVTIANTAADFEAGHLPGARFIRYGDIAVDEANLRSEKFLPDAELRKKFEAIGAEKATPLVSYCMVGMRASVTYFVARHLGYDARMYDGSIEDWTARKLPATTGR